MKNHIRKFKLLTSYAIWASLIVSACLIGVSTPAFGQGGTVTTGDETYGKGGTKETVTDDADEETVKTTVRIRDRALLREERVTTIYRKTGKKTREAVSYYDCKGKATYGKLIVYDILGNETLFVESRFKNGKQISGFIRGIREDGTKYTQKYNPKTDDYEDIAFDAGPTSDEISIPPPDTSACSVGTFKPNEIAVGTSLIREDSDPESFNTYGVDASYTRFVTDQVGVRASFNAHFREQGGVELSKISALGGIKFLPFKGATTEDRTTVFTHALFGVSHFRSKFGGTTFTDNSFTMKLGGGFDINLNENFFIRPLDVSYAPTFFGGATQHNVQFSFGAGFRFGGKSGEPTIAGGPSVSSVPQDADAKKCEWKRSNLGKDTNVTQVRSDKPTVVEVRTANLSGSGGFEYHCLQTRGTALITYKYTDVSGAAQEGKLRVFCNPE